jgi:serine/threonine protein kinase
VISAEQFARAKTIFLAASRLPKGDRSRFVATQCADDAELVVHVRRLLADDAADQTFLEAPAVKAAAPHVADGTRLGHFRIVRLLGEGGMGVVYEAQEDEPSRRVALKVIRSGVFSERLRSRFRHEIRVLGQLRHPGVAQIYEAGTFELAGEPVPYFAMELIEGRPLLACAQESGLGVRERLALIAQVCDAVHHAHQKGVIHRDLKPGNILVEEAASSESGSAAGTAIPFQVKVLDFGIARATDTDIRTVTIQTEPGQLIGTVPYMSPEQVAGQPDAIDIRSDVYSIGVIAFELLSGRLPYAVRDRMLPEAVRMIHEAEPTPSDRSTALCAATSRPSSARPWRRTGSTGTSPRPRWPRTSDGSSATSRSLPARRRPCTSSTSSRDGTGLWSPRRVSSSPPWPPRPPSPSGRPGSPFTQGTWPSQRRPGPTSAPKPHDARLGARPSPPPPRPSRLATPSPPGARWRVCRTWTADGPGDTGTCASTTASP